MCPCGRPSRRATRSERAKGLTPTYCKSCIQAEDMQPLDYDMRVPYQAVLENIARGYLNPASMSEQAAMFGGRKKSVVMNRLEGLGRRVSEGADLHARAQELLWSGTLTEEQQQIWELFVVDGLNEAEIARRVCRSRDYIYERVLGPCRQACGYPVRNYTPPKHRRGPNKQPKDQE